MAAATTDRNTRQRQGAVRNLPVKGSTTLLAGCIACVNASNLLVPGTAATGLVSVGVVQQSVTNSGADSAVSVDVFNGVWGPFGNSASTDAISLDDIGKTCYVVDNQTVALTDGSAARSAAGKVFMVDTEGVWVDFY